ncbi:MAG: SDR family oxidoreductase [Alicyclobacillus sp.]|nr:SDR family oxidoreductase [Alicyclobacillus sp.]
MEQRVAFVTSGAKGLGHSIVRALLEAGWDVYFTFGQSVAEARRLEGIAAASGRRCVARPVDLFVEHEVRSAMTDCLSRLGRVDALIHNFGPFVFERIALADYSGEQWDRMFHGNLTNFFWLYQAAVPGMRRRGFGRICTVGFDGAGEAAGWRFRAPYAAAKSALASLTRSIAREERQNGITANMICPGDIRGENKMRMICEVPHPEDRLGRPSVGEDVARHVVYLCSEDSQMINGTVTEVTGGYDVRAYDDGRQLVMDEPLYRVGQRVYVHPWACEAVIQEVRQMPNRLAAYIVEAQDRLGTFTAYQLGER